MISIMAMLLVLGCMRWMNSGLLTAEAFLPYNRANDTWIGLFALIGLIFPAYSVIALIIMRATRKNQTVAG